MASQEEKVNLAQLPEKVIELTDYLPISTPEGQTRKGLVSNVVDAVQLQVEEAGVVGALVDETRNLRDETIAAAAGISAPIGTYDASTGLATLVSETGEVTTYTPTSTADKPEGSVLNIVVAGSRAIAIPPGGTAPGSLAMEVGSTISVVGNRWVYTPKSSLALQNLNTSKIEDSGKLTGVLVPETQYKHVRGDTEMLGNSVWHSPKGVMLYEQAVLAAAFNRLRLPSYMPTNDTAVICRVYKHNALLSTPASFTLLAEVTIPIGQYNISPTGFQVIDLGLTVRVKTGEYLYIALWTDTADKLYTNKWSADSGVAPFRHSFFYSSAANQWNATWSATDIGAGFAQAAFELYLINNPADLETVKTRLTEIAGLKLDSSENAALLGAHLPKYQYLHERGVVEIDGNANAVLGDALGVGFYEPVSKPLNFDRIALKAYALSSAAITAKVFFSKTLVFNTASLTLLATVDYAAGTFNTVATSSQIIDLPNYVQITDTGYIYVALYCPTAGVLANRYWNALFGSGTERHRFMRLTTSNANQLTPWAATWTLSAGNFYQASLLLLDSTVDSGKKGDSNEARIKTLETTAVVKNIDGSIPGAFVPEIQFQHPRGVAEMVGANNFGPLTNYYGLGLVQQITAPAVVNKIRIPAYAALDTGTVEFRMYKGTGFSDAPSAMVLLYSVSMSSKDFNKIPTGLQVITLPTPVLLANGDYIHLYLGANTDLNLSIREWRVVEASPARLRFKTRQVSDLWGAAWSNSSSDHYACSFELSYVNLNVENRLGTLENKNPRLTIPSKIWAVVGIQKSVYFDALVFGKDFGLSGSQEYLVDIICTKGIMRNRCWQLTPIVGDVGTHSFVVVVYDNKHTELTRKTVSLIILNKTNPATAKLYHENGDSVSAASDNRVAIAECMATLTGGVSPTSTGLLGSGQYGKHEAHSGWKYVDFTNDGNSAAQAPLGNPYWNTSTGLLDITNYRTVKLGLSAPFDAVTLACGLNDTRVDAYYSDATLQTVIDKIKIIITAFLADSPGAKFRVHLPTLKRNTPVDSRHDGPFMANMWRFRELILSNFDYFAYHAQVEVGDVGLCVDRYYGYQFTNPVEVAASRYTETEVSQLDNVHLRSEGYKQRGDAYFPSLLSMLQ